jgi:hypothetical protein
MVNAMKKSVLGFTVAAVGFAALAALAVAAPTSGLKPGEGIAAFHPTHLVGPLANSDKCFPCTFQNRPQVQVWVNGDSMDNVVKIAKNLEKAVDANKGKEFKAMIVMLAPKSEWAAMKPKVTKMAADNGIKNVAIAMLEPTNEAVSDYKVNTSKEVKNTVFFYKNWKVTKTHVNFVADEAGMKAMKTSLTTIL